jgi:DNA-binding Lrp family transcriptional regulator
MDQLDRNIINKLQKGLPVCDRPYAEVAADLNVDEETIIKRLQKLLDEGSLTRFGPMFNTEKMGGAYSLVAMKVPENCFDEVVGIINSFPEVAHNYKRKHTFNLWFVVATDTPKRVDVVLDEIQETTGLCVYNMPKLKEYCLHTRFDA